MYSLRSKQSSRNIFAARLRTYTLIMEASLLLHSFLAAHGISHFTSSPHTPEHNGVTERKHQHIVEMGLTLLHEASLPTTYWTYAFPTAFYLINRLPSPILQQQSLYTKLFRKEPNYMKLRVFGCACYPWLRPYAKHKLGLRSLPCIFLGYSLTQSAYLCLHQPTRRIYTSLHVKFDESRFLYTQPTSSPTASPDLSQTAYALPTIVPLQSSPLVHTPSSDSPGHDPHLQQSSATATTSASVHQGNNEMGSGTNSTGSTSTSATPTNTEADQTQPIPEPDPTQPSPEL